MFCFYSIIYVSNNWTFTDHFSGSDNVIGRLCVYVFVRELSTEMIDLDMRHGGSSLPTVCEDRRSRSPKIRSPEENVAKSDFLCSYIFNKTRMPAIAASPVRNGVAISGTSGH